MPTPSSRTAIVTHSSSTRVRMQTRPRRGWRRSVVEQVHQHLVQLAARREQLDRRPVVTHDLDAPCPAGAQQPQAHLIPSCRSTTTRSPVPRRRSRAGRRRSSRCARRRAASTSSTRAMRPSPARTASVRPSPAAACTSATSCWSGATLLATS